MIKALCALLQPHSIVEIIMTPNALIRSNGYQVLPPPCVEAAQGHQPEQVVKTNDNDNCPAKGKIWPVLIGATSGSAYARREQLQSHRNILTIVRAVSFGRDWRES